MRVTLAAIGGALLVVAATLPGALADEVKSEARVKNKAPTLEEILLNLADEDPGTAGSQVSPTPGETRVVPFTIKTSDGNGHKDIAAVTYTLKGPDGVVLAEGVATSEGTGQGRIATWGFSWSLPYWGAPGVYTVQATATDKPGDAANATMTFDVLPTLAMVLDSTSLSFGGPDGTLEPGTSNRANPATVAIRNMGNVPLDLGLSGSDLAALGGYDAAIPIGKMGYSSTPDMANEVRLSTGLQTDAGFDLAPGESATKRAYFVLYTPSGDEQYVPATTYQGSLTLSAVVS